MELPEYENIYTNEDSHFFYVSTNNLVINLVKTYTNTKKSLKILDAGCGTGLLATMLQQYGEVIGIDLIPEALKFAKKRGVKVKKGTVEKLPFADNSFDIVVSIDVITHQSIKDDFKPLKEFNRVIKPGGILILRVSANSWLHMIHDKHVHMNHRYKKSELASKLKITNFKVLKLSFVHSILLPPLVIRFLWEKISKPQNTKSAIEKTNPIINNILTRILTYENYLIAKSDIPFGVGLIVVAKNLPKVKNKTI